MNVCLGINVLNEDMFWWLHVQGESIRNSVGPARRRVSHEGTQRLRAYCHAVSQVCVFNASTLAVRSLDLDPHSVRSLLL